jgi:hypothetical protein
MPLHADVVVEVQGGFFDPLPEFPGGQVRTDRHLIVGVPITDDHVDAEQDIAQRVTVFEEHPAEALGDTERGGEEHRSLRAADQCGVPVEQVVRAVRGLNSSPIPAVGGAVGTAGWALTQGRSVAVVGSVDSWVE